MGRNRAGKGEARMGRPPIAERVRVAAIRLDEIAYEQLRTEAFHRRTSISDVVRTIVADHLRKHPPKPVTTS